MQTVFIGLLALGLSLMAAGCDGGGANDDGSEEEPEPTAPAAPSGLEATSGNAQISLDWEAISEADSYSVYRSTSSTSGAEGEALEEGISSESHTDDTAENGTTYYYRVTAVDADGNESDASGEVEATPFDEPPDRP